MKHNAEIITSLRKMALPRRRQKKLALYAGETKGGKVFVAVTANGANRLGGPSVTIDLSGMGKQKREYLAERLLYLAAKLLQSQPVGKKEKVKRNSKAQKLLEEIG